MRILRNGIGLAYEDAGSGDESILLVHGWGMDRSVLEPLFEAFRTSHRVVSVDLCGFGESDAQSEPYTIHGYADDLVLWVRELGLSRPIVIGHSMGGMIALDFAARYPRETAAVVLLEAMVVASEAVRAGLDTMLEQIRRSDYRDYVAGLITYLLGPHFDPVERARVVTLAATAPQHSLVSALEGIIAFDSESAAANVKCPLLYVGTSTTYADLARFKEICPQLVTGQLVGCGHYFPLEVPDQLAPMVAHFIRRFASSAP